MCEYLGMKLAERAHANGVRPQSAYRWFRHGTMPDLARRLPSGTILVEARENPPAGRVALYVRVSAHDERADLDRQIARPTARATGQGAVVAEVDCEGWLGHEPPPAGPLRRRAPGGGAFGPGHRVVVADPRQTSDNLVRDMIDVLASFCAWLYGRRGARNRVLLGLACAKRAPEAARVGGEDD
jgi:putative resolvase